MCSEKKIACENKASVTPLYGGKEEKKEMRQEAEGKGNELENM